MQIPDKDVGLESGAAVAGMSSKSMRSTPPRTQITGGHTAICSPDSSSELCIRQPEIRSINLGHHFQTCSDVLPWHGDRS